MLIQSIVTGIDNPSFKPAVKRRFFAREHPVTCAVPLDFFCSRSPETFRIRYRFLERPFILTAHAPLLPDVYTRKLRGKVLFLSKNAPDVAACGAKIPQGWFRYGAGLKHFVRESWTIRERENVQENCSTHTWTLIRGFSPLLFAPPFMRYPGKKRTTSSSLSSKGR